MEAISSSEIRHVLRQQRKSPLRTFGEIALAKGFIYDEAARKYLSTKGFI